MKSFIILLALLPLLAGCANLSSETQPGADLRSLKRIHVEHRLADGRGLDEVMARQLQTYGYETSSGPLTMMPDHVDAIVSYEDHWTFDFTEYMIELDVWVRDARTGKLLASARDFRPGIRGMAPADKIRLTLDKLFGHP